MTDLEMTRLCAEAMGYRPVIDDTFKNVCFCHKCEEHPFSHWAYRPLDNDEVGNAQAMALVKKFRISIDAEDPPVILRWVAAFWKDDKVANWFGSSTDLNRAIVECVAKMQEAKSKF